MSRRVLLGVNIDHVATLRQARGVAYPDPVEAALFAERGGADGITVHLREDRRHIQDRDVARLRAEISSKLNLEMAPTEEMTKNAVSIRPSDVCLVPEKRQELTTEGGLDVVRQLQDLRVVSARLRDAGVRVSLFIDPEPEQVTAAAALGVFAVELHTGTFADARGSAVESELERLRQAARLGASAGLQVNAGHGLRLDNTLGVARIPEVRELNIGHSIVARAVLVGMEEAVREMRRVIDGAIEGEAS